MRIPTRVHGILDYLLGAVLIGLPWIAEFHRGGPETWVCVGLGAFVLLYSLITDYEPGLVRKLPMPVHLWLDALGAVLLAVSPWVLGFDEHVWIPHVAVAAVELLAAVLTNTVPGYDRRRAAR
ncbi:SPW repeat domain-containing protein [Longimicrobium terrae]|uniref:SPW repeat-containing integral membrane domain-containing protein n=1 Tax=Longimicrobium terrae TaxID=1639882 RepID=A0A841GUS8_9BACT|nr:hypothetical protein [Longimicrobium terrae]MBB4634176.1 hypothetical protein [Longimicrobium terrae]MBB6068934.1 hypothetical protein [Longimicrobium terrae]NNC28114.1 hypothetical protein [Longimicrobium terrae]